MGVLMFMARIHDLIKLKSNIELKFLRQSKKLRDLQRHAATIGNGKLGIGDLLNTPPSMLGRTIGYMNYAHACGMEYMNANAPMLQMYLQQGAAQNPTQQQQMTAYMMRKLYEQGRERAMQVETKNLKVLEEEMTQEKDRLETELKSIEQELKAARDARDQGIKDLAPKYTA